MLIVVGEYATGKMTDALWTMNNYGKTFTTVDWSKFDEIEDEDDEEDDDDEPEVNPYSNQNIIKNQSSDNFNKYETTNDDMASLVCSYTGFAIDLYSAKLYPYIELSLIYGLED